tara:strand:+ start:253 stop:372 length:120 start_codon:yes stop_codon:yes gene_type:complete
MAELKTGSNKKEWFSEYFFYGSKKQKFMLVKRFFKEWIH